MPDHPTSDLRRIVDKARAHRETAAEPFASMWEDIIEGLSEKLAQMEAAPDEARRGMIRDGVG